MTETRVRLWDASRQSAYVKERDEALGRRLDEREGTTIARQIDSVWPTLPAEERDAMEYLIVAGARSCVGHCTDPLLARLVERGLLIWPPGVRPVLTDDMVTSFLIPPAIWIALEEGSAGFYPGLQREQAIAAGRQKYEPHFTPLITSEITSDPFRPSYAVDDAP